MKENEGINNAALVIGGNGGIGNALVNLFARDSALDRVFALTREGNLPDSADRSHQRVEWLTTRHSQPEINKLLNGIKDSGYNLERICIATGTLHGDHHAPEKRIENIDAETMGLVFHVNAIIPMLWVSAITEILPAASRCVIAVLSARLGSISDNRRGGWYSYRGSKAALNMMLKTAAIECARRRPGVRLLAYHPGTTDTALSRPYQSKVPAGGLFTPEFAAARLIELMSEEGHECNIEFVDWAGKPVPW